MPPSRSEPHRDCLFADFAMQTDINGLAEPVRPDNKPTQYEEG